MDNYRQGEYRLLRIDEALEVIKNAPGDVIHSFMGHPRVGCLIGADMDKADIIDDIKRSYQRGWTMHPVEHDFGVCYMLGDRKIIRHFDLRWSERDTLAQVATNDD